MLSKLSNGSLRMYTLRNRRISVYHRIRTYNSARIQHRVAPYLHPISQDCTEFREASINCRTVYTKLYRAPRASFCVETADYRHVAQLCSRTEINSMAQDTIAYICKVRSA